MTALPYGWRDVALGDVIQPVSAREVPNPATEIPFIGMEHVEAQSGRVLEYGDATEIKSASPLVEPGDVLYGRLRPYLNKVAIAPERAYTSGEFIVFRSNADIDGRWLKWRFTARDFVDYAISLNAGDRPRVKWPQMRPFRLQLPPFAEQRHVVELLEDHLSRIDAAETELESAARRLAALAKASWRRAFVETDLAPVPLLDVASIANGQTPKGLVDRLRAEAGPTTVPFYKVGDMNAGDGRYMSEARTHVSDVDAKMLGLHIRASGTVLIPKRGGAIATNKKRLLAGPAGYDLNTMGLVPSEELDPLYLWHWLQGVDLGKLADGSQVPQINAPQIRGLRLPVPPIDAQKQIIDELEQAMDARSRFAAAASDARRRGAQLRRSILAAAFSGRLTASRDLSVAAEMILA